MPSNRPILSGLVLLFLTPSVFSQTPAPNGELLFMQSCSFCHLITPAEGVPTREALSRYESSALLNSMNEGTMRIQAEVLSPEERIAIAEYLSGTPFTPPVTDYTAGMCSNSPDLSRIRDDNGWKGWSPDSHNTRYQEHGGLSAADIPKLKLRWAFGIPGVTQSRSQPAVAGGLLFLGNQSGLIVALDAKTGCTHWKHRVGAGVRTAIAIGARDGQDREPEYAVYFADARTVVYALDARTGEEIWSTRIDEHPAARITGAPTLHQRRLYVPVSGIAEEATAARPDYECCTFRGSLAALDTGNGKILWKTYTVDEPKPRGKNSNGTQLWGPAGVSLWSAPTVDAARGLTYAASGNAFADPPSPASDAIIAFDLENGTIRWISQPRPGDTWILGCEGPAGEKLAENPNCPKDLGPDFDFAASPALITLADGRDRLIATQKSGLGYALDPDQEGRILWEYRWGVGSSLGGVWGAATDGRHAFFATADQLTPNPGGLHAVDVVSGKRTWYVPPSPPTCTQIPGCSPAQSAALTAIPGVVFTGAADGSIRAYASNDGALLWNHDSNREYTTVNEVQARGGSIDGAGPVVADGMLFVTSGNGGFVGMRGNVLLAFGVRDTGESGK